MLTPPHKLSPEYHAVAGLLSGGWTGRYADLAVSIGRSPKSAGVVCRLVKSYARRNASWFHARVYTKQMGRTEVRAK